jgi:hypothetical protein
MIESILVKIAAVAGLVILAAIIIWMNHKGRGK